MPVAMNFILKCIFLSIIIFELSGKVYAGNYDQATVFKPSHQSLTSFSDNPLTPVSVSHKTKVLGQKLMLDLRYFCHDDTPSKQCRQAVTKLPHELSSLLTRHAIGGVILFTDNLTTPTQIRELTDQLHATAQDPALPLFIAVDQEGGRVARLPTLYSPAFAGNMALGATYNVHHTNLARQVAKVIGQDLRALGINVNFAPTVDVNANPLNPVINVRSFGESASLVSQLGSAMTQSLQEQGVLAAIKHFPGHGDTHTDSHTGLPQVTHDVETIMAQDIAPFAHIITNAQPAFVMTAHIQFPKLDNSTLLAANGTRQIRPATLSRTILTNILREQLQFKGLIVTDALDMAGIAQYFTPLEAVLETFNAGADIALMPFTIRNAQDIREFDVFMSELSEKIHTADLADSFARIARIKQQLVHFGTDQNAQPVWTMTQKQQLATQLAQASVTQVFGDNESIFLRQTKVTNKDKATMNVLLVMPDELRCAGFTHALNHHSNNSRASHLSIQCLSTTTLDKADPRITPTQLNRFDVVIAGDISPQISLAEMGGMDDLLALKSLGNKRNSLAQQQQLIKHVLSSASDATQKVFVAMRTPYIITEFTELSDTAYAIYDYRVAPDNFHSDSLSALAMYLLNDQSAPGVLPVTLPLLPSAQPDSPTPSSISAH